MKAPFSSLLVANRGEIACRIFRTARAMGIRTIAVYSDADAKAKHVREADEAVHIGASAAADSYLRGDKVLAAAKATGAAAIHPGYGFLSENPEFAEAVVKAGIIWVGPTAASIRAMGLKDEAKRIAIAAGVPVLSGYQGEDQSEKRLLNEAKAIGFPVLIKAVAGGGGRGIREVKAAKEFKDQLASAQREAKAAFGDERVLIEKLVERPRHIEVQVFGDRHGGLVHLFERDCSLQRRRQKVIEEAPAPGMTEEVRAAMTDAALKVARAVKYENAGTVEFIVDGNGPLRPDGFWFLEMNTRLQVEHPVTEAVTGLDLVEWQLRVAAAERLPKAQDEIELNGHAIEARICAEDPSEGFRPSVGRILKIDLPHRSTMDVHAGFSQGDTVSPHYDSLIAKAIVSGASRSGAIKALAAALGGAQVVGPRTNLNFLVRCLAMEDFQIGALRTDLIDLHLTTLTDRESARRLAAALVAFQSLTNPDYHDAPSAWNLNDGFRLNAPASRGLRLEESGGEEFFVDNARFEREICSARVNGEVISFEIDFLHPGLIGLRDTDDHLIHQLVHIEEAAGMARVFLRGDTFEFCRPGVRAEHAGLDAGDTIIAPLPGKIVAFVTKVGATVKKGDALVTLEAMKMEHALKAPRDGVVSEVGAAEGAQVKEGAVLVRLEPTA